MLVRLFLNGKGNTNIFVRAILTFFYKISSLPESFLFVSCKNYFGYIFPLLGPKPNIMMPQVKKGVMFRIMPPVFFPLFSPSPSCVSWIMLQF